MKKILDMFFTGGRKFRGTTAADYMKERFISAAEDYAELASWDTVVDSAKFVDDSTGCWCVVSFHSVSGGDGMCGMSYIAYVDVDTGEVAGFSAESDVIWPEDMEYEACLAS